MSEQIWIRRQFHEEKIGPFEDRWAAEQYVKVQNDADKYWSYDSVGYFTRQSWIHYHRGWDPVEELSEQR